MGLWNTLKGQFIDIIEWLDNSSDTLVWRFYRPENEIMNGAKLVVREGQVAAFVNQGQLADVFLPGTYTLTTANLPILSKLQGWRYGFESPFKAEVYFISTRAFTDQKWGTKNPVMLRDAEFGMVRLRAFGTYVLRVKFPPVFLRELVGTNARFSVDDISEQLTDLVASRFTDALGTSKIAALDLAGNYDTVSQTIREKIEPDFEGFGLELVKLVIENISLPAEVEAMMDKRTSMGVLGNMSAYTQFQAANAMGDAAKNPSGVAGVGVGLGAGMAMAQNFAQAASATSVPPQATVAGGPPPLPTETMYHIAVNGQQVGPLDHAKLVDAVDQQKLMPTTLVWTAGMAKWTAAAEVPGLAGLFAAVPPPLPV